MNHYTIDKYILITKFINTYHISLSKFKLKITRNYSELNKHIIANYNIIHWGDC